MEPVLAARVVHDWAHHEGFLVDAYVPVREDSVALAEQHLEISEAGKSILRVAMITAVGYNTAARRITVFTRRAAPRGKRKLAHVPTEIDDVEIAYRQAAELPIAGQPAAQCSLPPFAVRQVGGQDRYTCGSSVSPGNIADAGTLGCLVRDAAGVIYGLSANHVTGSCSHADVGLPIIVPGIADVAANSLDPLTAARHARSLPFSSGSPTNVDPKLNRDCSIFRVLNPAGVSSYQRDVYDTPGQTGQILPNMRVEKVGRTTGLTAGTVTAQIYGPRPIQLIAQRYGFSASVYFDPVYFVSGVTDVFGDNGDSGALVTTLDQTGARVAVGMLTGGFPDNAAPGKKTAIVLPIEPVLADLGVTLVSRHNV